MSRRSSEAVAEVPFVAVRRTRPVTNGRGQVTHYVGRVTCPHCGRQHTHGLGESGDLYGHRMAHCRADVGNMGYELAPG